MKLKKLLSLALALSMALSLAACGNGGSGTASTPASSGSGSDASTSQSAGKVKGLTPEERSKEFITVGTGPTSGIYFPIGGAFATALKDYGYQTSAEATNATGQNIQNILNGDAEIAIAMQDAVMQAYTGTGAYEGKGEASDLRALMRLWPNYVQLVTVKGTGFAPESTVTITLHSEPVEVGTATTDASGDFTATVTVPATTEAGDHTVVAASNTPTVAASAPLTVTAPPAPAEDPSAAPSTQPTAAPAPAEDPSTAPCTQPTAPPAPAPEQGGKGGLARTGTNALLAVAAALIAAGAGTAFIRRSRLAKA